MRFKVGDLVRVKDDLCPQVIYGHVIFVPSMEDFKGFILKVRRVGDGVCLLQRNNKEINFLFSDEMLESVATLGYLIEKRKQKLGTWTLFVLDFDSSFSARENDLGAAPAVFIVPLEKQILTERLAREAAVRFHEQTEYSDTIIDLFVDSLEENNIKYQYIGDIDLLTYEERQKDYLADYIPRQIV